MFLALSPPDPVQNSVLCRSSMLFLRGRFFCELSPVLKIVFYHQWVRGDVWWRISSYQLVLRGVRLPRPPHPLHPEGTKTAPRGPNWLPSVSAFSATNCSRHGRSRRL